MKSIVLCLDGTGQKFQENKSNPLRFHYCLENSSSQISFYDPGVGTFDPDDPLEESGLLGQVVSQAGEVLGGKMLGYGIERNLADAYRYLMDVYEMDDEVFIFGFSRGAFTAHALAGFLKKCGLLQKNNYNLIPYALEIYLAKGNDDVAEDFRTTMSRDCPVKMIGAWDTVKSLGPKHRNDFFYRNLPDICEKGVHFVAADERRKDFAPELWYENDEGDYQEIWFPGVHGDVGGGYDENPLANASLRAMIKFAKSFGLDFQRERIEEFVPNILSGAHSSYTGGWFARGAVDRKIPDDALIHPKLREHRDAHKEEQRLINVPGNCVPAEFLKTD